MYIYYEVYASSVFGSPKKTQEMLIEAVTQWATDSECLVYAVYTLYPVAKRVTKALHEREDGSGLELSGSLFCQKKNIFLSPDRLCLLCIFNMKLFIF